MKNLIDSDGLNGSAGNRAQQYAAKRIADGLTVAALKRLQHKFRVVKGDFEGLQVRHGG
jgi:hypothetical protein